MPSSESPDQRHSSLRKAVLAIEESARLLAALRGSVTGTERAIEHARGLIGRSRELLRQLKSGEGL